MLCAGLREGPHPKVCVFGYRIGRRASLGEETRARQWKTKGRPKHQQRYQGAKGTHAHAPTHTFVPHHLAAVQGPPAFFILSPSLLRRRGADRRRKTDDGQSREQLRHFGRIPPRPPPSPLLLRRTLRQPDALAPRLASPCLAHSSSTAADAQVPRRQRPSVRHYAPLLHFRQAAIRRSTHEAEVQCPPLPGYGDTQPTCQPCKAQRDR